MADYQPPPPPRQSKIGKRTALNRKNEHLHLPCQRCGRKVYLHGNAILWNGLCLECKLNTRKDD
jgi:ribosomal protein L37E